MPLIALTGGIASGKSTIADRLRLLGAVVVDADALVRQVQQPGSPALQRIAAAFGSDVLDADGALDRARLGAIVFGDAQARERLNAIVHPEVRAASERAFRAAFEADRDAVVVYDVPLLAETRAGEQWDLVVVAHAPAEERIRRLMTVRGMSEDDARARVAAQADDATRLALADEVIDTSGTVEQTIARTDALWPRMRALGHHP